MTLDRELWFSGDYFFLLFPDDIPVLMFLKKEFIDSKESKTVIHELQNWFQLNQSYESNNLDKDTAYESIVSNKWKTEDCLVSYVNSFSPNNLVISPSQVMSVINKYEGFSGNKKKLKFKNIGY
jgi:hypothetical protein